MNERIACFIESLKKQLDGLPQEEILEAVSYYEEYLKDAAEAGKDMDDIFSRLDSPEEIARMVRTEMSITRAQRSPGLKNFSSAMKNAFTGVTTPFAVLLLSVFVVFSYGLVAAFFAGAFAVFLGAVVAALGLIYQAFAIPSRFSPEIIGTLGLALFCTGILLLTAYGLYKAGILFIRISAGTVRRLLRKSGKPLRDTGNGEAEKKSGRWRKAAACLAVSLAGLVLFAVSGLPLRFFIIFNSMKPENITVRTEEYAPDGVGEISIVTAHSCIRLEKNPSGKNPDKIILTYEQPDWLDFEMGKNGGVLSFYEKSNGRLPLFKLVTLHESRTELTVSIPEDYSPEMITVETTGGFVTVAGFSENIRVKTYSGRINLDLQRLEESCNIRAATETGTIEAGGVKTGRRTDRGTEYYRDVRSDKTIELLSSTGSITID